MKALISGGVLLFVLAAIAGWDARHDESAQMAAAQVSGPGQDRPREGGDTPLVPVTQPAP